MVRQGTQHVEQGTSNVQVVMQLVQQAVDPDLVVGLGDVDEHAWSEREGIRVS